MHHSHLGSRTQRAVPGSPAACPQYRRCLAGHSRFVRKHKVSRPCLGQPCARGRSSHSRLPNPSKQQLSVAEPQERHRRVRAARSRWRPT
eukprot:5594369-Pleurochrysis_carterae.AAC.2